MRYIFPAFLLTLHFARWFAAAAGLYIPSWADVALDRLVIGLQMMLAVERARAALKPPKKRLKRKT
jgi:hypothetical protein